MPEPNADYYDQYPVSESPAMQSVLRGIEQAAAGEYQPDPTRPDLDMQPQETIEGVPVRRIRPFREGPVTKGGHNPVEVDEDGYAVTGPRPPAPMGSGGTQASRNVKAAEEAVAKLKSEQTEGRCNYCGRSVCPVCKR